MTNALATRYKKMHQKASQMAGKWLLAAEIVWMRYNTWMRIKQIAISCTIYDIVLTELLTHFEKFSSPRLV